MKSLLEKEILFNKEKAVKSSGNQDNEIDFVLHWIMPKSGKRGFIVSFRQDLA